MFAGYLINRKDFLTIMRMRMREGNASRDEVPDREDRHRCVVRRDGVQARVHVAATTVLA